MDVERCVEGVLIIIAVEISASFASVVIAGSSAALSWCVLVCGEFSSSDEFGEGMAFTLEERQQLNIHGLLPPCFLSQDVQVLRILVNFERQTSDLDRSLELCSGSAPAPGKNLQLHCSGAAPRSSSGLRSKALLYFILSVLKT
ncbi:NADP-dependent malic enzyme [Chelonia mydas]|uniref:NADP-dependent malic enzyme n=1 Tax=Chelonia mydas TaxID=8469 RepID=M7C7S6_CHEMY|nr:NADP-dependent malic enzyme [Chelonia mydas]